MRKKLALIDGKTYKSVEYDVLYTYDIENADYKEIKELKDEIRETNNE